jgi:hypothetical protein
LMISESSNGSDHIVYPYIGMWGTTPRPWSWLHRWTPVSLRVLCT